MLCINETVARRIGRNDLCQSCSQLQLDEAIYSNKNCHLAAYLGLCDGMSADKNLTKFTSTCETKLYVDT